MKSIRIATVLLFALAATAAFAQSDAQASFDKLKSLAGTWEGKALNGQPALVSYRVTGNGSSLMSEIQSEDDMITMFHLDGNRLLLTHYCGAGNQPRMQATVSPDGKTFAFNFIDATNLASPQAGHMHRAMFTLVDADHHTEEWTWSKDGKENKELFSLQRKK
jgi:hypothetical protein